MTAGAVVHIKNPFDPFQDRRVERVTDRLTVRQWLDLNGIEEFDQATVCIINGVGVMRDEWALTTIGPNVVCVFMALPLDGGGKKSPFAALLTIAVLVAGNVAGGALAAALGETAFARVAGGLLTGLIVAGGSALVSALVPPPSPSLADARSPPAASPTYTLQGQGNSARLGAVIPEQFGLVKVFPDLIAREPWTEFVGNEQFLHQAHCMGVGEFDIEQVRIADTDIANFKEITTEIVAPGQPAALFDVNVIPRPEVTGQELVGTNEQAGGEEFLGPFILNPVDTVANQVQVDVIAPGGMGLADAGVITSLTAGFRFEVQQIDDDDQPVGAWIAMPFENIQGNDFTAIRETFTYTLPAGDRFQVRGRRTNSRNTAPEARHQIYWSGLKAFVDGPDTFADVTLLMVKMRATDNLSSSNSRLVNVTATRKLPVWDDQTESWTAPQATSSIVWASAYIAKTAGELDDSRLPLEEFAALDAKLAGRTDFCNGRFDAAGTVWEALHTVARCGRAVPTQPGGLLRLVRDEPQAVPTAMFGPRNIIDGSFKVAWMLPDDDSTDAVTLRFFNARTWKWDEVTGMVAGSAASKLADVTMPFITDRAHALREAEAMAHDHRYRRVVSEFETEMDGMLPTYGDEIAVTAELLRRGIGGDVTEWDAEAGILTLSEEVSFTEGEDHYLALRARDGSVAGKVLVTAGPKADQVIPQAALPIEPYTGGDEERTYFAFGAGLEGWADNYRVTKLEARQAGARVAITAVREDSRAHPN